MKPFATKEAGSFFIPGGTLPWDAPSYVTRPADDEVVSALSRGEFCYILTARQLGKSSLMVRTVRRLRERGIPSVVLDLTALGQNLTAEQWYGGMLMLLAQQMGTEEVAADFWIRHGELGPLHRWFTAVDELFLTKAASGRRPDEEPATPALVVFVDEVDAVRSLPFPTDEFFAAIRAVHNRHSIADQKPRLCFCLLGVATPGDLIQDPRHTPFNIGRRIELTDFSRRDLDPLASGLSPAVRPSRDAAHPSRDGTLQRVLDRVQWWTGGHPYLVQRLCREITRRAHQEGEPVNRRLVDRCCREIFLRPAGQRGDENLLFVGERLRRTPGDPVSVLELYSRLLPLWSGGAGRSAFVGEADPRAEQLRLAGVARSLPAAGTRGFRLTVRNRIYAAVFNREWVHAEMPDGEVRRQRAAYFRGVMRTAMVAGCLLAAAVGTTLVTLRSEGRIRAALAAANRERDRAGWEARRAQRATDVAQDQEARAKNALAAAEAARLLSEAQRRSANASREESRRRLADNLRSVAVAEMTRNDPAAALPWQLAALRVQARGGKDQLSLADRLRMAFLLHQAPRPIQFAAGFPGIRWPVVQLGGKWLLGAAQDGKPVVVPVRPSGVARHLPTSLAQEVYRWASPDGRWYCQQDPDGSLSIRRLDKRGEAIRRLKPHSAPVHARFSRDGTRLAVVGADRSVLVIDPETGKQTCPLLHHSNPVRDMAFSPSGALLVTGTNNDNGQSSGHARVWSLRDGRCIAGPLPHGGDVVGLSIDPSERTIVTTCTDEKLRIWHFQRSGPALIALHPYIAGAAISPDGSRVLSYGSDHLLRLWNSADGMPLGEPMRHADPVVAASFNGDGTRVLSASLDGTARLWDGVSGAPMCAPLHHPTALMTAHFDSTDDRVTTVCADGSRRLWDIRSPEPGLPVGVTDALRMLAVSPDGTRAVLDLDHGKAVLWDLDRGQPVGPALPVGGKLFSASFTPDGSHFALAGEHLVTLCRSRDGQRAAAPLNHAGDNWHAVFGGEAASLYTAAAPPYIQEWDRKTGRPIRRSSLTRGNVGRLAISKGGRFVAAVDRNRQVVELSPLGMTDTSASRLLPTSGVIHHLSFSPDGQMLAVAQATGEVSLWHSATATRAAPSFRLSSEVRWVAFSPDGQRIAAGGDGRRVRIWSLSTGREVCPPLEHARGCVQQEFSPDGKWIATWTPDRLQVWDTRTGLPITVPIPKSEGGIAWSRNGFRVVSFKDGILRRLDVRDLAAPLDALPSLVAVMSSRVVGGTGSSTAIAPEGFSHWWRLSENERRRHQSTSAPALSWHLYAAEQAEKSRNWTAAAGHLRRALGRGGDERMLRERLARALAESEQWSASASEFRRLTMMAGANRLTWYRRALSELMAGQPAAYRITCREMYRRHARMDRPSELDMTAWTHGLAFGASTDPERIVQLLQMVLKTQPRNHSWLNSLGAALLRAEQPAEAADVLREATAVNHGEPDPLDFFLLALAEAGQGQRAAARLHYQEGVRRATAALRPVSRGGVPDWDTRAEIRLFWKEAERSIDAPTASAR